MGKKPTTQSRAMACFNCKLPGHVKANCPAKAWSFPVSSSPTTSIPTKEPLQFSKKSPDDPIDSDAADSDDESELSGESHDANDLAEVTRHLQLFANANDATSKNNLNHALMTAPIISSQVKANASVFSKYGLLGLRSHTYNASGSRVDTLEPPGNLIYSNTSAPWSAFICGQQGAGKSYTLSCLLENALLPGNRLGKNEKALAGLVFHYDKNASDTAVQVCEAAYLCSEGVPVQIFVMPSNIRTMKEAYRLPGVPAHRQPVVRPLLLQDSSLKVDHMLTIMGMRSTEMPLYMSSLMQVVRTMKEEDVPFTIKAFEARIDALSLTEAQKQPLVLRMQLLKSLVYATASKAMRNLANKQAATFGATGLTIVDLSCSTVSESDVCSMYQICLSIFLASRNSHQSTQKQSLIIAIDEAHKFLIDTPEARSFTEELIRLIRQQRHLSSRVLIATQEPTLSTTLMDLCDVSIIHRFRSPAWFDAIKQHLAGMVWSGDTASHSGRDVFETIVGLGDGQALLFCPNAYLDTQPPALAVDLLTGRVDGDADVDEDNRDGSSFTQTLARSASQRGGGGGGGMPLADEANVRPAEPIRPAFDPKPLHTAFIKLQIRQRLTADGGKSMMAED